MTKDSSAKKIYGLIGYPVKHSFSPAMHNAAFKHLKDQGKINYEAEYRLFEVPPERLEDFLLKPDKIFEDTEGNSIRAGDVLGFNITIPHKVKAKEILVTNFPESGLEKILKQVYMSGAVNTVKRYKDQPPEYTNTDVRGFYHSLKNDLGFETKNKNVFLIGCGGVGRAVITALTFLASSINNIYIYDSNDETVKSTQKHFGKFSFQTKLEFIAFEQIPEAISSCQLLVNCSPLGMKETDPPVIDKSLLRNKNLYVYDVVYNRQTQLVKDALSLGLKAKNGEGMLLYQGVLAFEIWIGKRAPVRVMRRALEEAINK